MPESATNVIDTLRLSPEMCAELLREAKEKDARSSDRHDRLHSRFSYTAPQIFVLHVEASDQTRDYRVLGKNISQGGLAVFHGQVLYPNTRCKLTLRTTAGEAVPVAGVVVYCKHFRARIHEIGLRFDSPVDVTRFVTETPTTEAATENPQAEMISVARDLLALLQTDPAPGKIKPLLKKLEDMVQPPALDDASGEDVDKPDETPADT